MPELTQVKDFVRAGFRFRRKHSKNKSRRELLTIIRQKYSPNGEKKRKYVWAFFMRFAPRFGNCFVENLGTGEPRDL
jgi:hypothetical protein